MRDYKVLEELISSTLKIYKDNFNAINTDYELEFYSTLTNHHVEVKGVKAWVAYLRVERAVKPKNGKDEEAEHLLLYNQSYKFKNIGERTVANAPWKYDLYLDLLQRLMFGGLEYAELLKRMQTMTKDKGGKPISDTVTPKEPEIIITDEMPAPLTDDEKEYKEWVKKNQQR